MKNWKKNLMAAAVLLVVCVGIYMNWMYSGAETVGDLTDTLDAQKVLAQDGIVLNDSELQVNGDTVTDYFAAVRLSRQEARDSAVSLLQEAMSYNNGENTSSNAQLEQIVQTALCEAQIESLVIAKGYTDCVAYMGEENISIAVSAPEEGLSESEVALISDIVTSQTDYSLSTIRIIEVK